MGFAPMARSEPDRGLRFDAAKLLLDPYGLAVAVPARYSRDAARQPGDNTAIAMKSVVVDPTPYDWEGDARSIGRQAIRCLRDARARIHEPSELGVSPEKRRHLRGTDREDSLPRATRCDGSRAIAGVPVRPAGCAGWSTNYWGYAPVSFFAPHRAYSSRQDSPGPMDEFRDMVKALHRAGIEVILDVVFNHTAEGDGGPTFCFRGLENRLTTSLTKDRVATLTTAAPATR